MAETKYVATEPLFVGLTRAHNPGDEVPAANVAANGWQDSVARVGTKAAEKAASDAEPLSTSAQSPAPK